MWYKECHQLRLHMSSASLSTCCCQEWDMDYYGGGRDRTQNLNETCVLHMCFSKHLPFPSNCASEKVCNHLQHLIMGWCSGFTKLGANSHKVGGYLLYTFQTVQANRSLLLVDDVQVLLNWSMHFSQTLYSAGLNLWVILDTLALSLPCRRLVTKIVYSSSIASRMWALATCHRMLSFGARSLGSCLLHATASGTG